MNRAAQEEEKKKLIDKFFNYAETPIKEWLAEYLGEDVTKVFPDYVDSSEDIGFKHEDKFYVAYFTTMDPNQPSQVSIKLLTDSESVRKSCSMLFDAFQLVMPSVIQTADKEYVDRLKGLYFDFNESKMAFSLAIINSSRIKKMEAGKQINKLYSIKVPAEEKLAELNDPEKAVEVSATITDVNGLKKEITNHLKQVDDLLNKSKTLYESVTEEEMVADDKRCEEINTTLPSKNKIFIVIEETDPEDEEVKAQSMKRLPAFGSAFQDTEDETFTEKLRKEYDLNV